MMKRYTFLIEDGQYEALEVQAQMEDRSVASVVRRAINKELSGYGQEFVDVTPGNAEKPQIARLRR